MNTHDDVLAEVRDNVLWITINREKSRNALNDAVLEALARRFDASRGDERVRAIVLTGAGSRAFCAGGDLKEFIPMVTQNIGDLYASRGTQNLGQDFPVSASLVAVLRASS